MYENMVAYVDESGAIEAEEPFVAGIWFTAHEEMWQSIIRERRDSLRFNYAFHFHKISCSEDDWQFKFVRRLFKDLRRVRHSWYSRMIHVSPKELEKWSDLNMQDKYDNLIAELVLSSAPKARTKCMKIVISDRARPLVDTFLPEGLEQLLNDRSSEHGGPKFCMELENHKNNDFLQMADVLTSGIRQIYYPSKNRNKCMLAGMLQPLVNNRIIIWEW